MPLQPQLEGELGPAIHGLDIGEDEREPLPGVEADPGCLTARLQRLDPQAVPARIRWTQGHRVAGAGPDLVRVDHDWAIHPVQDLDSWRVTPVIEHMFDTRSRGPPSATRLPVRRIQARPHPGPPAHFAAVLAALGWPRAETVDTALPASSDQ